MDPVTGTRSVLFSDIVGSTEMRARLGEEAADRLRRWHDQVLRETIKAERGVVIKGLGDGVMAAFSSSASAISCAVSLNQQFQRHARDTPQESISLRIGVSSGDVSLENGDCFGMPVVEASRLCAAANAGQILVADVARLLSRGRRGFRFQSMGDLSLKGIPDPVPAFEVLWEPLPGSGAEFEVPLPPRLSHPYAIELVGREAELQALKGAWEAARAGRCQIRLISGEPGVGKTRLASEFARRVRDSGAVVLMGASDEDISVPYRPFVEALRHLILHAPEEMLAAHVAEHHGELARIAPELGRRIAGVPPPQAAEPDAERYLLFEAVAGLLRRTAQGRPVLLILDDLHWAESPDAKLLKHLVKASGQTPMLILGTFRDSDLAGNAPLTALLADLRREPSVERIALTGLDEEGIIRLVTAAAGHDLDAQGLDFARAVHRETEGSPFFATEILRHLRESGELVNREGRWALRGELAALTIPDSVREVIGRRLSRLSEETGRLLSLAAVIGRHFDLPLLARIAEKSEDAVLDALDEAHDAALVAEVAGSAGDFSFNHALIRTTLYSGLAEARRVRLHRRIGEALEELAPEEASRRVDELAHHWLAATKISDAAKAARYARAAGERALANLAYEAAVAHFDRGLTALDPHDRDGDLLKCDLWLALGDAQRRAADARYRQSMRSAAELAVKYADAERLALAALGSARPGGLYTSFGAKDEQLWELYEAASRALGPEYPALRARLLGQMAGDLMFTDERDRRHALSAEALELARASGDRVCLAYVLSSRLWAINDPYTLEERLPLCAQLVALAEELGSDELRFYAGYHSLGAWLEAGDPERIAESYRLFESAAGRLRQPLYTWMHALAKAMLAKMKGDDDAERLVTEAFQIGQAGGQSDALAGYGSQLGSIRLYAGRAAELIPVMQAQLQAAPNIPSWRTFLMTLYCTVGRSEEARPHMQWFHDHGFDLQPNWTFGPMMHSLSWAVWDLRDTRAAEILYPRILPLVGRHTVVTCTVSTDDDFSICCAYLARCLGRLDEAETHARAARASAEKIGHFIGAEAAAICLAGVLIDRGGPEDLDKARRLIEEGLRRLQGRRFARLVELYEETRARLPPPVV